VVPVDLAVTVKAKVAARAADKARSILHVLKWNNPNPPQTALTS